MPSVRISKDLNSGIFFMTLTVLEWIDVFTNEYYFAVLAEALQFYIDKKQIELYAFVFMTNHIHLIIKSEDVISFVRRYKSFTTKKVKEIILNDNRDYMTRLLNRSYDKKESNNFQLWQENNYPEYIEFGKFLKQKIDYIHNNPVKKGYVVNPEDWKYSSAHNYCGDIGVLDIVVQDLL